MTLKIRYECPECHQTLPLNFQDFAPGKRRVCATCKTPGRITQTGLERFTRDLHQYFQA